MLRSAIRETAERAGIIVRRHHRRAENGHYYETVVLETPLAPWLEPYFSTLYEWVSSHTMVDRRRCCELHRLSEQTTHLPGVALEVGCWRGGSGCFIAAAARHRPTYLCDTFAGVVKASDKDNVYHGGEHGDASIDDVREIARRIGLTNVVPLNGIFPDDFAEAFAERQFAFGHLDVNVYQSAKDALDFVWPRMPIGGVLVFDDYGVSFTAGITKLVDEYRLPDRIIIYNLNFQAVMVKVASRC